MFLNLWPLNSWHWDGLMASFLPVGRATSVTFGTRQFESPQSPLPESVTFGLGQFASSLHASQSFCVCGLWQETIWLHSAFSLSALQCLWLLTRGSSSQPFCQLLLPVSVTPDRKQFDCTPPPPSCVTVRGAHGKAGSRKSGKLSRVLASKCQRKRPKTTTNN